MQYQLIKRYLFLTIFTFSIVIFLAHTAFTKLAIFADGQYYYTITRSLAKDFDLNFINEYEHFNIKPLLNHRGLAINPYPPGTSLFWLPSFLVIDNAIKLINLLPFTNIDRSGFGLAYQTSAAATSTLFGVLGLYTIFQLLKAFFKEKTALITTFALFSTTNLLFYIAVEPINSHAISFSASAIFAFYFLKVYKKPTIKNFFYLGILVGIVGLIRTQDLAIISLPLVLLAKSQKKFPKLILLSLGLMLGFSPQLSFWKLLFNTFWKSPYLNQGFIYLTNPKILHVLFNSQNGFLLLTPITLAALFGLFIFRKKQKTIFKYAIIFFALQLYLISSWSAYTQGGSFSIRMLIPTYPFLSFGLASFFEKLTSKIGVRTITTITLLFSALNAALIIRYLWVY